MHPFQVVAATHGATVLRVCRALVGPVDAEDAWSETFLAALRAYPDLPPGSNVEAWLVTIAQRKAIDILRRRTRDPVPSAEIPEAPSILGIPGSGDTHARLWAALARLPMVQRQAVVWHHLIGLPYGEVSEKIGNSPAAARRAGADGIAALRRALAANHPPSPSSAPVERANHNAMPRDSALDSVKGVAR